MLVFLLFFLRKANFIFHWYTGEKHTIFGMIVIIAMFHANAKLSNGVKISYFHSLEIMVRCTACKYLYSLVNNDFLEEYFVVARFFLTWRHRKNELIPFSLQFQFIFPLPRQLAPRMLLFKRTIHRCGLTRSLVIHARIDHWWGSTESPFYEISEKAKEKKREIGGLFITKFLSGIFHRTI